MWLFYIFFIILIAITISTETKAPPKLTKTPQKPNKTQVSSTITTPKTSKKPVTPTELEFTNKTKFDVKVCPFGYSSSNQKTCEQQQDCQTDMKLNSYCSETGICCQENEDEDDSLCYDKRLPLFGEPKCTIDSECRDYGAVCKSGHCCPNFHYTANETFRPPSHFYISNFSCSPGKPIPPGFQFAYCSKASETIAYLGVVDKCGRIQHIVNDSKCVFDFDCPPGNICVRTTADGVCFKDPEDCATSIYYKITVTCCYTSFVSMILYFMTRACYEHPLKISEMNPFVDLQLYSVTEEAEDEAMERYGTENMSEEEITAIRMNAARKAWDEDVKSMNRPALEYVLNWCGYVVEHSEEENES
ncbi:hypothetical protein GCK72_017879 [Caenorhabditis remanei]|uniref:Domain of unknown function DX domain-containing protein n=2 Tax=Caenorhabditis remanei TaxID=31234 RepID=A0A6A5G9M3_CAERE|nr:hypothetical protein GCK72_017879 [Caenorhabditis remanei]KAF1751325.1 hypothetical protein GCK72_017879 [Caenorhabditis remanei]